MHLFSNPSCSASAAPCLRDVLVFDPELVNEPCREIIRELERLQWRDQGSNHYLPCRTVDLNWTSCFSEAGQVSGTAEVVRYKPRQIMDTVWGF